MKKILLINPIYNPGTIPKNIPLSKIAAGLKYCGVEVEAIDFVHPDCEGKNLIYFRGVEKEFIEKISSIVSKFDAVYITTGTGSELKPYPVFPRIKLIAQTIKRVANIPVIVGGALINLYSLVYKIPHEILCESFIDHLAVGNEYYSAMKIMVGECFPQSVSPMWEIWDDHKYPKYKSIQYHVGCPYSCDFCFEGKIYDQNSDHETLDNFIESISEGEKIIVEDSVLMSYKDFDEMMENFQTKKIEFSAYARISEIVKSPEKIVKLKKAGCQSLIVGIETLDNDVLKGHNKNIVSSQTREGLDILRSNGIEVQGCFMLGFPEDTIKNMERTIDFAIEEKLNGYRWHIYQPNYSAMEKDFYSTTSKISVMDHLSVQLNVPDNCLAEVMLDQPEIGKLDEHFMIRGKNYISPEFYAHIGYKNKFTYQDIKCLIDDKFPKNWILNEELLYKDLFRH